jgi:hypothetical protein
MLMWVLDIFYQTFMRKLYTPPRMNTLAQSICTHYSCFENMGRFVTLKKKQVQKKAGRKKTGSLLLKKKRGQAASSLFE